MHTPAPWHLRRTGRTFEIHNDNDTIANVQPSHLEEDEANVRLMAHAPALLAALEDVLGTCSPFSATGKRYSDEARALIRKVRGLT